MNEKPSALETQLYLSLRATLCNCQYERTPGGIPLWRDNGLTRKKISSCSRCIGVAEYEARYGQNDT